MPPTRSKGPVRVDHTDAASAVDEFVRQLDHAHKPAIELLRQVILGVDPAIAEGIKWNAPSFRTTEWFATTHLRSRVGIGLILHLGAKVRSTPEVSIDDPDGLLQWLGKDRAMLSFADAGEIRTRQPALRRLVRQWIACV